MFKAAILVGVYAYGIFLLGLFKLLQNWPIFIYTFLFLCLAAFFINFKFKKNISLGFNIWILLIFIQAVVNLIGVLGPELSFDALWYHLTIPKIYLTTGSVFFIPGNLLYYSGMPKLIEMLYIPGLLIGEIIPKLIHYFFGIVTLISIYQIARFFVNKKLSLLASLIFYSNLVVGWESITAFVDLPRAYFESLAFLAFLYFTKTKKNKYVFISGSLIGLSLGTKTLALGGFLLLFFIFILWLLANKKPLADYFQKVSIYLLSSFLFSFPFYLTAFLWTGNPFYPIFNKILILDQSFNFNFLNLPYFMYELFLKSPDPISPIYVLVLPFIVFLFKKFKIEERILIFYSLTALVIVFLTPHLGGGRFLLPYLPILSVLSVIPFKYVKDEFYLKWFKFILFIVIFISIIYRFTANSKFLPVILGYENKDIFMQKNLNFSFGDFYDIDGYFKTNIERSDKVLVYGVHNLYYINFPFAHYTYAKKDELFNYVLVQNSPIPERFGFLKEVYRNNITHVKLYTNGEKWHY